MGKNIPVWRLAIQDEQHPLHRAAWLLFSDPFDAKYTAQALAGQKDAVLAFIYTILDTEQLYDVSSLGGGSAPINAVRLLGEWQVVEAIPRLLRILQEEDWDTIVHDQALAALGTLGPAVIEPMLAFAANNPERRITAASVISSAGKRDLRAYEYIKTVFEEQTDDIDIEFMAESLLVCDSQQAIPYLEDRLRQGKIKKSVRKTLEAYLQDARTGGFDDL